MRRKALLFLLTCLLCSLPLKAQNACNQQYTQCSLDCRSFGYPSGCLDHCDQFYNACISGGTCYWMSDGSLYCPDIQNY